MQFLTLLTGIFLFFATSGSVDARLHTSRLAPRAGPTITLENGSFFGTTTGTVNSFKNIPFAKRDRIPRNPIIGYNLLGYSTVSLSDYFSMEFLSLIFL